MEYSFTKTLKKGIRVFVLFGLPWLVSLFIQEMPTVANLSIGTLLMMAANYLKAKMNITLGGLL